MPQLILVVDIPDIYPDAENLTRLDHALRAAGAQLRSVGVMDGTPLKPADTILSGLHQAVDELSSDCPAPARHRPYAPETENPLPPPEPDPMPDVGRHDLRTPSISSWRRQCGTRMQESRTPFGSSSHAFTEDDKAILDFVSAGAPVTSKIMKTCYPSIPIGRLSQRLIKLKKRGILWNSHRGPYTSPDVHFNWSIGRPRPIDGVMNAVRAKPEQQLAIDTVLDRITPSAGAIDDATIAACCLASIDDVRECAQARQDAGRLEAIDIAHNRRLYAVCRSILERDPRASGPGMSSGAAKVLDALPEGAVFLATLMRVIGNDLTESEVRIAIGELEERRLAIFHDLGRNSLLAGTAPGLAHPSRSKVALRAQPAEELLPSNNANLPAAFICANDLTRYQSEEDARHIDFEGFFRPEPSSRAWLMRWGERLGLLMQETNSQPRATEDLVKIRCLFSGECPDDLYTAPTTLLTEYRTRRQIGV